MTIIPDQPQPATGDNELMKYAPWMGFDTLPENYFGEGGSHTVWR